MISIRSLSYTYPGSSVPTLANVNLEVDEGELVLIRGASGSGKSTLLSCINGIIPHILEGTLSGDIEVDGFRPADVPIGQIARTVGTVFQNPDNQIFMLNVRDDAAFGCENMGLPLRTTDERVDRALRELDLLPLKDRETSKLSGGQKQRLAIAGAYAMQPRIFLFDEPMTDLDENGRREFVGILKALKETGHTILLTDHDDEGLDTPADKVVVLGEDGPKQDTGLAPFPMTASMSRTRQTNSDAISLTGIDYEFPDRSFAVRDLTFAVKRGELTAIVGNNGSGKTTLFKVMLGLLKPQRGSLTLLGMDNPSLDSLVGKVGYLFQNPDEQLFSATVEEELFLGTRRAVSDTTVEDLLRYFRLERYRHTHPHCLSRGERKKVALLSVLALGPEIILLDEPTTGLDERNWQRLMDCAGNLCGQGKTVIFSSHNARVVRQYARRVIRLEEGRIVADEH
jgi:energy-coupling factor transporter ATP-binding protein EcfA2